MNTAAYQVLVSLDGVVHYWYEQCDTVTAPYMAVFTVGSTLVYYYDLRPTRYIWHQEVLRTGGMERNEVRRPVSHVVVIMPCRKKNVVHTGAIFSGFHCSMETSTIIRVGARNYIRRIVAVSQEHVPVCITRNSNTARKWHVASVSKLTYCVGGRNGPDFSVVDRSCLDFSVGITIDMVLCGVGKWLGLRIWIDFGGGRKRLVLESWSQLTWFSCRGAFKIDLFLECRSKLTWFCMEVAIELVLVRGPKLTCFLCEGQN